MTDVATRPVTEAARYAFGPEQVEAIKRTVAKDCTDVEFVMFLELASRYNLDPFAKQIWAAKMGGDGKPVSIIVGRDGYLAIAERHPAYQGMDGDVIREGDHFDVLRGADGPQVVHDYGEHHATAKIVGAWAVVYRRDRRPTYFYAPLGDYKPTGAKLQYSPWGKQESVMMLKCAQSTALRLAFNISGFVPAEEAGITEDGQMLNGAREALQVSNDPDTFEWGGDPEKAAYLRALVERANEVRADAFRPAKVRIMLAGKTEGARLVLTREMEEWISKRGGLLPGQDPEEAQVVGGAPGEPQGEPQAPEAGEEDEADRVADRLAAEVFAAQRRPA